MAVIIKVDNNGNLLFESIKGLDISEADREKAIKLNELVAKEISSLADRLKKSKILVGKNARSKVEVYWEFGSVLRKIFFDSGLIDPAEKKLFWSNVKMHTPEWLLAKDRGLNRIHIAYCFRLAGYPKELALKKEWSEWVYLFDSPFINSEDRFDDWDKIKIENEQDYTTRENTRLFIQCLNSILKDIETKDLSDEELIRCYEGSFELSKALIAGNFQTDSANFKTKLKNAIATEINSIGKLMSGGISVAEFVQLVTTKI